MRTKEFLSVRGIEFESVDVQAAPDRVAEIRALGLRTLPVVARGDQGVSGQSIAEVAAFLGVAFDDTPKLAPDALAERLTSYLDAAGRYAAQLPAEKSEARLAHRDWPYWKLVHHAFHITDLFLEQRAGARIEKASFAVDPPADGRGFDTLAAYGAGQRARFAAWWAREGRATDPSARTVFEGRTLTVHQLLERTTWHTCQHVRQMIDVLESEGIAPDGRLERRDWDGLPVPESIWADQRITGGTR